MLIEAQTQKLLLEQEKLKENADKNEESMEVDDAEPIKAESHDVDIKEAEEKPPEEPPTKKDDSDEKPIDIDPKTYCKLGHFHLLLEDYAKGKRDPFSFLSEFWLTFIIAFQLSQHIKSTEVFGMITGKTRRSCTVSASYTNITMHCAGEFLKYFVDWRV